MNSHKITISDSAATKIKELFLHGQEKGKILRISVEGGGCSGFQYLYNFVDQQNPDDIILNNDGATVLIDLISSDFMKEAVIDYVETLGFSSFEIKNPTSSSRCGCGNSFSI